MDRLGIVATFGECYRSPLQAWANGLPALSHISAQTPDKFTKQFPDPIGGAGIAKSLHTERLAVDYNFFTKEEKLMTGTEAVLKVLGAYWESLDKKNRWGGNFTPTKYRPLGDPFHFERNA